MDLVSILSGFWNDFGSSWAPKSEKMRSRNCNEKSLKKSHAVNSGLRPRGGGGGGIRGRGGRGGPWERQADHTEGRGWGRKGMSAAWGCGAGSGGRLSDLFLARRRTFPGRHLLCGDFGDEVGCFLASARGLFRGFSFRSARHLRARTAWVSRVRSLDIRPRLRDLLNGFADGDLHRNKRVPGVPLCAEEWTDSLAL